MLRAHSVKVSVEALAQQQRPETAEANQEGGTSLDKRGKVGYVRSNAG